MLFAEAIHTIISNRFFQKEDFRKHDLLLCESFCLLWQNAYGKQMTNQIERNEELNQGKGQIAKDCKRSFIFRFCKTFIDQNLSLIHI